MNERQQHAIDNPVMHGSLPSTTHPIEFLDDDGYTTAAILTVRQDIEIGGFRRAVWRAFVMLRPPGAVDWVAPAEWTKRDRHHAARIAARELAGIGNVLEHRDEHSGGGIAVYRALSDRELAYIQTPVETP